MKNKEKETDIFLHHMLKWWEGEAARIAPYRTKLDFIPVFLPTKLYYGEKNGKMTTVLEYSNGEKIKVTGNLKNNKKESHITLINGVIIALFKHEFKKIKINEIYDNQTESEALAQIRNMLLGHFISRQTFKSEKHFNKWLIDFVWDNI